MTEANIWEGVEESFNQNVNLDMSKLVDSVPEDYKSMFSRIKTPKDFVESYANAQKALGKKSELPGLDDKDGISKIYKHLGLEIPDTPDGYEFKDVKADEGLLKAIKETFAGAKLDKKQAETVVKKFAEIEQEKNKAEEVQFNKFKETQVEARKGKYGEKLGETENVVNFAINKLANGNEEFEAALKMLADDNNYFEMFKTIGATFNSENPNGPQDKQPASKGVNSLDQELADFLNPATESGKAYLGKVGDFEKTIKAQNRVQEIYKIKATQKI